MVHRKSDPFAEREAQKYDNPIPSREYILEILSESDQLLTHEELVKALALTDEVSIEALRRRLKAMRRDGQIMQGRHGRYGLIDKMDLLYGTVEAHRDGFGFVKLDNNTENLFLSAYEMRPLLHGDKVLVCLLDGLENRGKREAKVVEILERKIKKVAGRLVLTQGLAQVVPDDQKITSDIIIPTDQLQGAQDGQIVVAEIVEYPTLKSQGIGKIVEILGEHMAPGMEIELAIRSYDLPHSFPEAVLQEAKAFSATVSAKDKSERVSLADLPFITIDGEDAKDFDDAVYAVPQETGGWSVFVAIADVSHYVKPGSALDAEAMLRGNSVYFPNNVIPMLPENLSNGLCSLNPQVDRLVLVCQFLVSAQGKIGRYRFFESVICSKQRFTYNQVTDILKHPKKAPAPFKPFVPLLQTLHQAQQALTSHRYKHGAITFESSETKIVFGEGRKIKQIVPIEYSQANRLIEECMLAANVCAALYIRAHNVHGIYRLHNAPSEQSVTALRQTLGKLGLELTGGKNPAPKHYALLLERAKKRREYRLINMLVLRSLKQATYDIDPQGAHFGLGFSAYTHFTSPIRRYPDLLVHRIIRGLLNNNPQARPSLSTLQTAATHSSLTERRADEATRDAIDWLKCEFMLDKVGESHTGCISGVTNFGLFVQLDDIYVEGLLHISHLGRDYYHFDQDALTLTGKTSGKVYSLGDKIQIQVARVSLDDRKIDFALLTTDDLSKDTAGRKKKRKKSAHYSALQKKHARRALAKKT